MTDIPRFQLSGSAPQNYELYSHFMVDPFIDELIRRANLEQGSAVLDVPAGPGDWPERFTPCSRGATTCTVLISTRGCSDKHEL